MSVDQMREYIRKEYPDSENWAARVKAMKDNQVIAIYYKIIGRKLVEQDVHRNRMDSLPGRHHLGHHRSDSDHRHSHICLDKLLLSVEL